MLRHQIGTQPELNRISLIHEGEGAAAKAMESLGISLEAVRQQVEEIASPDGGRLAPDSDRFLAEQRSVPG
jgi:hypothetical protein